MMFKTDEFWYMEEEDFQVLQLPYVGGDLAMLAILPREVDGLESLEKKLTAGNLEDWISKLRRETVQVHLPFAAMAMGLFKVRPHNFGGRPVVYLSNGFVFGLGTCCGVIPKNFFFPIQDSCISFFMK